MSDILCAEFTRAGPGCVVQLFTELKDWAALERDASAEALVDHTLDLWTKMLTAAQAHDDEVVARVVRQQHDAEACIAKLRAILDAVLQSEGVWVM